METSQNLSLATPANTRHWLHVGLRLGHRLRRCPNLRPTLGRQRLVFSRTVPSVMFYWPGHGSPGAFFRDPLGSAGMPDQGYIVSGRFLTQLSFVFGRFQRIPQGSRQEANNWRQSHSAELYVNANHELLLVLLPPPPTHVPLSCLFGPNFNNIPHLNMFKGCFADAIHNLKCVKIIRYSLTLRTCFAGYPPGRNRV